MGPLGIAWARMSPLPNSCADDQSGHAYINVRSTPNRASRCAFPTPICIFKEETSVPRYGCCLGASAGAQFVQNAFDMGFYRSRGHGQLITDGLIAQTLHQVTQDG